MIAPFSQIIIVFMRVFAFVALFAGPLGAMTLHQERGLGQDANAAGLVLITSMKRS